MNIDVNPTLKVEEISERFKRVMKESDILNMLTQFHNIGEIWDKDFDEPVDTGFGFLYKIWVDSETYIMILSFIQNHYTYGYFRSDEFSKDSKDYNNQGLHKLSRFEWDAIQDFQNILKAW